MSNLHSRVISDHVRQDKTLKFNYDSRDPNMFMKLSCSLFRVNHAELERFLKTINRHSPHTLLM